MSQMGRRKTKKGEKGKLNVDLSLRIKYLYYINNIKR